MLSLRAVRISDILVGVFLLLVAALLLVPVPTWLLDILLVTNLSFGVILLLAGIYMPNALALLSFPSLLLLTTLFRLGLNVASTRLILSEGEAGDVIRAFGGFLIQGEIVVGIIIFAIITIVNLVVVTRGAARVSEVAARFTLDALPGKQLAIDADVRAGLISAEESQMRRDALRKESQLYGAMDGSMKFVQGDAIAGMFIIFTNIIGGIYLGVSNGMTFQEAIANYTTLTVGDGLVHQIPAILISICAGIVVTRIAASEGSSLGADVQKQVLGNPAALVLTGALLLLLGTVPGVPKIPFGLVSLALIATGVLQYRSRARQPVRVATGASLSLLGGGQVLLNAPRQLRMLEVQLGEQGLYQVWQRERESYRIWWEALRSEVYTSTGLPCPTIRIFPNIHAAEHSYMVSLDGMPVLRGETPLLGTLLVYMQRAALQLAGLQVQSTFAHPLYGSELSLVGDTEATREFLRRAEIRFENPLHVISLQIIAELLRSPEYVLGVTEVLSVETQVEKNFPGLLSQTVDRQFLTTARLAEIMRMLIRDGVSAHDIRGVIESISDYCATSGATLVAENEFDVNDIVQFIRSRKKGLLVDRALTPRGSLKYIVIANESAEAFAKIVESNRGDRSGTKELMAILQPLFDRGLPPVAIAVMAEYRVKVALAIRASKISCPVFSFDELPANSECVAVI